MNVKSHAATPVVAKGHKPSVGPSSNLAGNLATPFHYQPRSLKMQIMSFTAACKHYFGYKQGQTLGEFMAEVKELTPEDRAYFTKHFPSVGIEIAKVG